MKFIGNWNAWESKDGSIKRIYVADEKYLEEGANGLCLQSCNFSPAEIEFIYKLIGNKSFIEVFEQIKKQNTKDSENKKNAKALTKERDMLLAAAKTEAERDEIFVKYSKLIKAAKFA